MAPLISVYTTGYPEIMRELSNRMAPRLTVAAKISDNTAAKAASPIIAAGAPVATGATQRSMRVRGGWVGPTTRWRIYPIHGTSRGVKPNPWVERGARRARPVVRTVQHRTLKAATA